MIKDELCVVPIEQHITHPISYSSLTAVVKWSPPPTNYLAIADCLFSLPSIYSDSVILAHTKLTIKQIEQKYQKKYNMLKIIFFLSKTLE